MTLGESDGSALDRLLAVNVRAPFQLTSGLIGSLADDARVLFTSSIVAKTVFPGISAYALTKGAIDTLTRYLAAELGERGIRVNAIAPGAIDTEMAADFVGTDEGKAQVKSIQALKRVGQPSDIANVAGFLAGIRIHLDLAAELAAVGQRHLHRQALLFFIWFERDVTVTKGCRELRLDLFEALRFKVGQFHLAAKIVESRYLGFGL